MDQPVSVYSHLKQMIYRRMENSQRRARIVVFEKELNAFVIGPGKMKRSRASGKGATAQ